MRTRSGKKRPIKFKDLSSTIVDYRRAFLRQVDEMAPEVGRDLTSLVGKYDLVSSDERWFYGQRELMKLGIWDPENRHRITGALKVVPPSLLMGLRQNETALVEDYQKFRIEFDSLIERYALSTEWLQNFLFEYLDRVAMGLGKSLAEHYYRYEVEWPIEAYPFHFAIPGWRVTRESDEEFRTDARMLLEKRLDSYLTEIYRLVRHCGYKENRGKRKLDRVKWLVRWTVQNRTMKEIADEFDVKDEKDIKKAFVEFELYGLPRRRKRRIGGKYEFPPVTDFGFTYVHDFEDFITRK